MVLWLQERVYPLSVACLLLDDAPTLVKFRPVCIGILGASCNIVIKGFKRSSLHLTGDGLEAETDDGLLETLSINPDVSNIATTQA